MTLETFDKLNITNFIAYVTFMIRINMILLFSDLLSIFDVESLIRNGGLLILFLVVYGSTGLFFCFFLPTGAFLFTGGIFAATGGLNYDIFTICSVLILASVLGNVTGYWLGWKTGPLLYKKEDSRFFKKQHLVTADSFYKKFDWLAIPLAFYLPIIRTFSPVVSGMIPMKFRRFILLTIAGSVIWILSFVLAGYFIGRSPLLKSSVKYIVIAFILVVTVPLIMTTIKEIKKSRKAVVSKK